MRQLNLDQVRALIKVIDCGSFTAAAFELNLTQPAVSLQVQELENRFGVKLVERVGRRIRPTAAGQELAQLGRQMLAMSETVHRAMRRYSEGFIGQSRVGTSMTTLIYLLPPIIRHLKDTVPSLEIVVRTGFSETTLQGVRDGDLDIGICTGPLADKSVDCIKLDNDALVAILPLETPDVPDLIEPSMVGRWPIILGNPRSALRNLMVSWIGSAGPVPRPIMELDNVVGIKSVVGAGLGISLIPELAIIADDRKRLLVRSLSPPLERDMLLVHRKDRADEPAVRYVREALIAHMNAKRR